MKQFKNDVVTVLIFICLTFLGLEFVSWISRMAFENTCMELEEQYLTTEIGEIVGNIEDSINFGKTLENYYGMEEVLHQVCSLSEGNLKAAVLGPQGNPLYVSFQESQENRMDLAHLYTKAYQQELQAVTERGAHLAAGQTSSLVFPVYESRAGLAGYLIVLYQDRALAIGENLAHTQTALFIVLEAVSVLLMLLLTSYRVHSSQKMAQYAPAAVIMAGMSAYILFLFGSYQGSYHRLVEQKAVQSAACVQKRIEGLMEKGLDAGQLYRLDGYIQEREQAAQSISKITLTVGSKAQDAGTSSKDGVIVFPLALGAAQMQVETNQAYIREKIRLMTLMFGAVFAVCMMVVYELTNLAGILSVRVSDAFNKQNERQAAGITSQLRVVSFLAYTALYVSTPYAAVIMRSWDASVFGLSESVSASLPLTAELFCILAVSAVIQKVFKGERLGRLLFFVFPFLILGNLACTAVRSPYLLIGLRAFCGIGAAFMKYWLNCAVAAGSMDEKAFRMNCGGMNAGLLGGITAGASLGAVFAQALGYQSNYFFTAGILTALAVWMMLTMPWKLLGQLQAEKSAAGDGQQSGSLAGVFENPRALSALLFGCVPLNIGLMYVVSFIPSYMDSIGQSAVAASYVYLVNGLFGMYLGVLILKILRKASLYLASSLALFLAAAGMLVLLAGQGLGVVMLSAGILGLFDGFGTPSITSFFTSLSAGSADTAGMLTVCNMTGSAVQIFCPALYGLLVQTDGQTAYLAVFGIAYLAVAVLFMAACRPRRQKEH